MMFSHIAIETQPWLDDFLKDTSLMADECFRRDEAESGTHENFDERRQQQRKWRI